MAVTISEKLGLKIQDNSEFVDIETTAENFGKIDDFAAQTDESMAELSKTSQNHEQSISSLEKNAEEFEGSVKIINLMLTAQENKNTEFNNGITALEESAKATAQALEASIPVPAGTALDKTVIIQCCPGINRITLGWLGGVSEYIAISRSTANCDLFLVNATGDKAPSASEVSYNELRQLEVNITTPTNGSSSQRVVYALVENVKSFKG
ncbi:MAG: hypothetical protein ACI4RU_02360 [Acutalibacteraceae bacterium]